MNEISEQFLSELKALLRKYNAELSLEDFGNGPYAMSEMTVWAYSRSDEHGDLVQDCIDIRLGTRIDGKEN